MDTTKYDTLYEELRARRNSERLSQERLDAEAGVLLAWAQQEVERKSKLETKVQRAVEVWCLLSEIRGQAKRTAEATKANITRNEMWREVLFLVSVADVIIAGALFFGGFWWTGTVLMLLAAGVVVWAVKGIELDYAMCAAHQKSAEVARRAVDMASRLEHAEQLAEHAKAIAEAKPGARVRPPPTPHPSTL